MKKILLSGGTGFIGSRLIDHLLDNFPDVTLTVLIRDKKQAKNRPRVSYCLWDVNQGTIAENIPGDIDTIIHLAGASIAEKRWTKKRKKVLLESRIQSTNLLVEWILSKGNAVRTFVSASAIGWYGEAKIGQVFSENDPAADDFLGQVCLAWESASRSLCERGVRVVWLRTGLVLHPAGGMLKEMQKAYAFRVAPRFGSGKQVFSWISLVDLLGIYALAASDAAIKGAINAVAPHPVSQITLIKALLRKRSSFVIPVPIPAFALKIGLGELSIELLKHAPVSAQKITDEGYVFQHPQISDVDYSNAT